MKAGNSGRTFGYARVSTREQHLDRQLEALASFGVDPDLVFADKVSGASLERPEYQRMLNKMKPGDALVVKSIDRLGRNYEGITEEWRVLTRERGIGIVVLDMPLLDTRARRSRCSLTGTFIADLVLQILSYVAQVERESMLQRQSEGIAAAKGRGVKFGRPRLDLPDNFEQVRDAYRAGVIKRKEAAAMLGTSERTFSRWIR